MNLQHGVTKGHLISKWIIIGLILLISAQSISATGCIGIKGYSYNNDGFGTFTYTFSRSSGVGFEGGKNLFEIDYDTTGYDGIVYYLLIGNSHIYNNDTGESSDVSYGYRAGSCWGYPGSTSVGTHGEALTSSDGYNDCPMYLWNHAELNGDIYLYSVGSLTMVVSGAPINLYYATGITNCTSTTKIYELINSSYILIDETTSSSYNFTIVNGYNYKLVFNDGKEYEFTCTGNKVYNYDGCGACTININDECANLLKGAFTVVYDKSTGMNVVYFGYDNPITLPPSKVNKDDKLDVIWSTWYTGVQKTCFAQFNHDINLYDPFVYWDMEVYVYDNESNPIDHVNVDFNQDCVINGYPTRNKYTDSSGMASFTQCENDNANLVVSKDGYKTLSTSVSGGWYDAYTPTYQVSVVLQSSDSDNSSTWDLINDSINDINATEIPEDIPDANGTPNDINIYFRNMNGDYVNQINDTDDYVRCYYSVNTPDSVDMTLVFQKSFTGYYFYDIDTYSHSIDNNSYGYFEIPNSYFNNSDYLYRVYIYDYAYPFDDRYAYLNVVNQTNDSITHYENLTGYCMFMNTNKNGSIDYREDITCYTMIISDNASLRTVSLELYDNSTILEYKNLTNSSYDTDNIYGWYLGYNYTLGHNYSLVLKGYDDSILDVDNVIAYNLIGNKLTIKVTDSFNHLLSNVYIFCEHYGSINTGYLNYGTFEGLPDGDTRYKASKTGYRSGAWKMVNLTSENEVVTYQLTQKQQARSTSNPRMSDDDAKNLYYPLMYFLGIVLLLGALINVIK